MIQFLSSITGFTIKVKTLAGDSWDEWVYGDTTVLELKRQIEKYHRKIKQNSSNNQKAYHYCLKSGIPRKGLEGLSPIIQMQRSSGGDELPFQ